MGTWKMLIKWRRSVWYRPYNPPIYVGYMAYITQTARLCYFYTSTLEERTLIFYFNFRGKNVIFLLFFCFSYGGETLIFDLNFRGRNVFLNFILEEKMSFFASILEERTLLFYFNVRGKKFFFSTSTLEKRTLFFLLQI